MIRNSVKIRRGKKKDEKRKEKQKGKKGIYIRDRGHPWT